MNIGIIARYDNSGLATLAREFVEHLKPAKILLVDNGSFQTFPERFKDYQCFDLVRDGTSAFLQDLDLLLTFETFYNWSIVDDAKAAGVKTVLYTMFEMTPEVLPKIPDFFLCPSKLDLEYFPEPKAFLPPPICTDHLQWQERTTAKTFIHTASHGGQGGRKGTSLLIEAMKHVDADIKLIINSWSPFKVDDPRIEVRVKNFKHYWQAFREGDVLVYPQGANGICLPIIEAMSSGLAVITTDIYPFNEYMPKDLLFKPLGTYRARMAASLVEVEDYVLSQHILGKKIQEIAGKNILEYSHYGKHWAQENSWDVYLPRYLELFEQICKT